MHKKPPEDTEGLFYTNPNTLFLVQELKNTKLWRSPFLPTLEKNTVLFVSLV